jgi:hypothetical protein
VPSASVGVWVSAATATAAKQTRTIATKLFISFPSVLSAEPFGYNTMIAQKHQRAKLPIKIPRQGGFEAFSVDYSLAWNNVA